MTIDAKILNTSKMSQIWYQSFYAIVHDLNSRVRQSMTNCNAGWQYLNCLALILVTGSELLLVLILLFQNVMEKRKEDYDKERTEMWITGIYSLFWFTGLLSKMLDKRVIARYFTLILSRGTFFCFFFNHRSYSIFYVLPKVFHKLIAARNMQN